MDEMMDKNFEKIVAGLKYWNLKLDPPIESYETRLILQKLTYLCKSLGINLNKYEFNLYLNGPYSSDLANDYYKYSNFIPTSNISYHPTNREIEVFDKIKQHIINHPKFKSHRSALLEATSTVMLLNDIDQDLPDDEIMYRMKELKPYLEDLMIVIAIDIVKKIKFNPELIPKDLEKEIMIWEKADD
ncbi:MAG: hypothetical protein ACTSRA_06545 [Promethearchaeota archaeon]